VDTDGLAQAAFVYALPHTKSLRVAMPLSPAPGRKFPWPARRQAPPVAVDPQQLPAAPDVVRGWQAQLRRGMRMVLPDATVTAAVEASRAYAVLSGERNATAAVEVALARYGLSTGGGTSWAAAPIDAIATWRRVRGLIAAAGPTYTWAVGEDGHDPGVTAEFLVAMRNLMVREDGDRRTARLALCSLYPPEWAGQAVEVHDAPTAHGRISYAVRWHDERPALLWECERAGVRLEAPGLDRSWSSTERTGEALLAPFRGRVSIPLADPD
jgi:hypothetical protein